MEAVNELENQLRSVHNHVDVKFWKTKYDELHKQYTKQKSEKQEVVNERDGLKRENETLKRENERLRSALAKQATSAELEKQATSAARRPS